MPTNSEPRMNAVHISVIAAFARLGFPEGLDAVRDRFDTAERDGAGRECPEYQEERDSTEHGLAAGEVRKFLFIDRERLQVAKEGLYQPPHDEQGHDRDVQVRRRSEQTARFLGAAAGWRA